jgi:hypothetical protein
VFLHQQHEFIRMCSSEQRGLLHHGQQHALVTSDSSARNLPLSRCMCPAQPSAQCLVIYLVRHSLCWQTMPLQCCKAWCYQHLPTAAVEVSRGRGQRFLPVRGTGMLIAIAIALISSIISNSHNHVCTLRVWACIICSLKELCVRETHCAQSVIDHTATT